MENLAKLAEMMQMISQIYSGSDKLGKKVVQKMFYFFERSGVQLNLRYGIHYYGPYSSRLDNYLHILEDMDYIKIDISGKTHKISPGDVKLSKEALTESEKDTVETVAKNFSKKTPLQMEALATMDYVSHSIFSDKALEKEIKDKFREIKGTKFNESEISEAYNTLKKLKFIA